MAVYIKPPSDVQCPSSVPIAREFFLRDAFVLHTPLLDDLTVHACPTPCNACDDLINPVCFSLPDLKMELLDSLVIRNDQEDRG